MNIKNLSDKQLHQNLLTLKSKESRIIASIISHLEEVYRRRLFAHYKCSSIYDYCIRILGYSNGEAHKKISACKLASHCQGVKESIASGELSLSNAASVQVFLNRSEKLQSDSSKDTTQNGRNTNSISSDRAINKQTSHSQDLPEKLNTKTIIDRVKNKSTRECELELEKIAKENNLKLPDIKPSLRRYGEKTLVKILLDSEQLQLLKSRLNLKCEQEMLQLLVEEKLKATEPKTEIRSKKTTPPSTQARSVSPAKRAIVIKKAQNQCENCGSRYHLQIDHKISVALGGGNDSENLRLLCRSCNQRAAIEQLGFKCMDKYINKKFPPSQKVKLR
ncbi:MAG: HNH endonuclease [Bdellovibrionales bacterium]|nr:HNH endonuclease [Bdellovibrionales bacterium]